MEDKNGHDQLNNSWTGGVGWRKTTNATCVEKLGQGREGSAHARPHGSWSCVSSHTVFNSSLSLHPSLSLSGHSFCVLQVAYFFQDMFLFRGSPSLLAARESMSAECLSGRKQGHVWSVHRRRTFHAKAQTSRRGRVENSMISTSQGDVTHILHTHPASRYARLITVSADHNHAGGDSGAGTTIRASADHDIAALCTLSTQLSRQRCILLTRTAFIAFTFRLLI